MIMSTFSKEFATAFCVLALCSGIMYAQKQNLADWEKYADKNLQLGAPAKGEKRVVLMGSGITADWPKMRPEFFKENKLISRGISGQTSFQFLLRFREDVINLKPKIVVINCGMNDIAENMGAYDENLTFGNVVSMVELARYNKIKVILTSCLPTDECGLKRWVKNGMRKVRLLNARIQAYAKKNKIPYVDYFSAMVNANGDAMDRSYAAYATYYSVVHPNAQGYEVMERLLLPVIQKLR